MKPNSKPSYRVKWLPSLAAVVIAAACSTEVYSSGLFSTSAYIDTPPDNEYTFIGWEDSWGRGSQAAELAAPAALAIGTDFAGDSFNDKMSSFEICNNTGADYSYLVRLWKDTDSVNKIYEEHIEVANNQCTVVNILGINDQVTSVGIVPTKL